MCAWSKLTKFFVRAEDDLGFVLGIKIDLVFVLVGENDLIFVRVPKVTWFCVGDRNGLGFCGDGKN